jgi:uncharacterized protein YoaH (UPF0181 family)
MTDLFTAQQLKVIEQIIGEYLSTYMFTVTGLKLPRRVMNRLRRLGFIDDEKTLELITRAFQYGLYVMAYGKDADTLTLEEFIQEFKDSPTPLGPNERAALRTVRQSTYTHIKHLEKTIVTQTGRILDQGNKEFQRQAAMKIQEELAAGIAQRKTIKQVASAMRSSTMVYAKNFYMVAATELNNAYSAGRAQSIIARHPGEDPRVYKIPRKDCCVHCKRLYLKKDGVTPKVFRMSKLVGNGNNIGRSKAEWKPVIESTHPECRCLLFELPKGFGFDATGRMVYQGMKKSTIFDTVMQRHKAA